MLKERKAESEYECDGIIIAYNTPNERVPIGNPDYAFAFKNVAELETAIVTVKQVEWNVSKDGYLKPILILEPIKLSGVMIKRVTAFNAKYIVENKIGPNTQIKLVRSGDVIPHILEIIKSSKEPQMPTDIEYEWNDSNVDIIAKNNSVEQKPKKIFLTFVSSEIVPFAFTAASKPAFAILSYSAASKSSCEIRFLLAVILAATAPASDVFPESNTASL